MAKINKLGVFSFAKFHALLLAILGFVAGIFYSIGGFFIDLLVSIGWVTPTSVGTPGLSFGTVLALGALIGMPLLAAAAGFIVGLIEATLYNLYARRFGGIVLDFE